MRVLCAYMHTELTHSKLTSAGENSNDVEICYSENDILFLDTYKANTHIRDKTEWRKYDAKRITERYDKNVPRNVSDKLQITSHRSWNIIFSILSFHFMFVRTRREKCIRQAWRLMIRNVNASENFIRVWSAMKNDPGLKYSPCSWNIA
jgi:hypothetical protein